MAKSDNIEIDRRIQTISKSIIDGWHSSEIVEHYTKEYKITPAQVYTYIKRARNLIKESISNDLAYEISKAQQRYETIYRKASEANQFNAAVSAVRGICELRGLNKENLEDKTIDIKEFSNIFLNNYEEREEK